MRAKLIFGLFCIGGAVALLAVRAPAQQTANQAGSVPTAPDPAALDAQLRPYGFAMLDAPLRQGSYYLVRARDPRGIETRMVIEADSGRIVSATPTTMVRPPDYSPYYDASPRIISILQADDEPPVPERQARVTRDAAPWASTPQRPARTASREPRREMKPAAKPEPAQPRRMVRQVVPPREQPYRPAPVPLPPADPSPRMDSLDGRAVPAPMPRSQALPRTVPPSVAVDAPAPAQAVPGPRSRPRTILAPPPYAEGPTPLKPLHHRDSKRFAPAQSDVPPAPPDMNAADVLPGSERHAAVPPSLPSIPSTSATVPVPDSAGAPAPQAADAHANANDTPEESPPGTVTLDATSQ